MTNQIQSVSFHNQQITVLNHENKPYIEMRSIVENIGLDWGAQLKRIKRNSILNSTMVIMTTVAKDGKNRELICLPLGYLNGWLFGIDTNRVKPETRPNLEQYQLECFDVLYNHFMPKVAQQYPNTVKNGLSDDDWYSLAWLYKAAYKTIFNCSLIEPALRELGPSHASAFYSITHEYNHILKEAKAIIAKGTSHIKAKGIEDKWNNVLPIIRHEKPRSRIINFAADIPYLD